MKAAAEQWLSVNQQEPPNTEKRPGPERVMNVTELQWVDHATSL
jgi:hypothetical protein